MRPRQLELCAVRASHSAAARTPTPATDRGVERTRHCRRCCCCRPSCCLVVACGCEAALVAFHVARFLLLRCFLDLSAASLRFHAARSRSIATPPHRRRLGLDRVAVHLTASRWPTVQGHKMVGSCASSSV